MTAEQVKKALESHGGVRSVVPYVMEYPESAGKCPTPRIPDVSLLHNYRRGSRGGEMGEFSPPPPFFF